jgi:sorting nexin-4
MARRAVFSKHGPILSSTLSQSHTKLIGVLPRSKIAQKSSMRTSLLSARLLPASLSDYFDLAQQFQKLSALEPGVTDELTKFATTLQDTSEGWKELREHTDQSYLGSLKDMEAYGLSVKALLKTREQKQLDFEALTEYLTKAAQERDSLASHGGNMGASGFLRQKIEDVRGVDHEQARRERQRRLEVQIQRLQTEVENAKKISEAFDEEVVKEVGDFERIKAVEFRDALEGLADANVTFFQSNVEIWEKFVQDLERLQEEKKGSSGEVAA